MLAANKGAPRAVKGKEAQMAKWDEEVRKSLASKRGAAPTLTKQQQVLVQAQLEQEAQVRQRVVDIQVQLLRGLALVKSVVNANVNEFPPYIAPITQLLLEGVLRKGKVFVGQEAFVAYLVSHDDRYYGPQELMSRVKELARCCSDRLDTFRRWLGIATLRSLGIDAVPEDLEAEPLHSELTQLFTDSLRH